MITREQIRELAAHVSDGGCALTFYYQPVTPKDQSHREEAIHLKDMIRQTLREAEGDGRNRLCSDNLKRLLDMADNIHGNSGKGKVIFADSSKNIWQEFDVPARLERTQIILNQRFHLRPLMPLLAESPSVYVCLMDKLKARVFAYRNEDVLELRDFVNQFTPEGAYGGVGLQGEKLASHNNESAKRHYKAVCEYLEAELNARRADLFVFGVGDENWAEVDSVLSRQVSDRILGRFRPIIAATSPGDIREQAERLLRVHQFDKRTEMLTNAIDEANADGRGATGPTRVVKALERGEVQCIFLDSKFHAPGSECTNCGHIGFTDGSTCELCGQKAIQMEDIGEAMLAKAMQANAEVYYIAGSAQLADAGHIVALLRFRADQNTPVKLAS